MKKYLLIIEDLDSWEKFKQTIQKDINSEIMGLIKEKVDNFKGGKNEKRKR